MLIEIHMLQNHAPANLNRDETGAPKDAIFGGIPRARISSQCIKRSIRSSPIFKDELKDVEMGIRTRYLPELVKKELLKKGVSAELAEIAAKKATGFGNKEGKEQKGMQTAQIMFFGPKDIDAVIDILFNSIEAKKKDPKTKDLKDITPKELQTEIERKKISSITSDIALFGRMTTSAAFVDVEASMQVAHAISTNKVEREFDFFVAIDDMKSKIEDVEDKGAGMMGDVEFNSSCFYKYFSLDVEGFIRNVFGETLDASKKVEAKNLTKRVITAFLKAAIFTTPSGKQNTFAAHQLPDAILIEIRPNKVPVSYANAFIEPSRPVQGKDLTQVSIEKFLKHAQLITDKFSLKTMNRLWFTTYTLPELQKWDNVSSAKNIDALFDELGKILDKELK